MGNNGEERTGTPPALSHDLILKELERVLASSEFSRSHQMRQFLRFVVEETLDGRGQSLKEYVIGLRVYNRGDAFDPRIDPIVRVQANKLRKRLAAYYAARDAATLVQIEIPKGTYVPTFRRHATPQSGRRRRRVILTASAAVSSMAALLSWWIPAVHRSVDARIPSQLTFDTGWNSHPAVSRDGSLLAFASDRPDGSNVDIWVSDLAGGQLRRLTTHPAIDWTPDFSPDGHRIVFRSFRAGGGIYSIPVEGGPETLIAAEGFSPRYSPDGRWIAFTAMDAGNSRLYVVPAEGGTSRRRLVEQDITSDCPVWTPDGRGLLFKQSESDTKHDWWFVPFDLRARTPATARRIGFQGALAKINGIGSTLWTCPGGWLGHEMFFSNNNQLYRVPFSGRDWSAQSGGALVLAGPGIESVRTLFQPGGHSSVVFARGQTTEDFWAVPLGARGETGGGPLQVTSGAYVEAGLYSSNISISRDGRFLAFATHNAALGHRILFRDLQTRTERAFSPANQIAAAPVMTPDARRIAWVVKRDGKGTIFTGGTNDSEVHEFCSACGIPRAWSPNGSVLLYTDGPDLWSVAFPDGSRRLLFKQSGYAVDDAGFSPDGSWVAMVIAVEGKSKVQGVVAPFDRISDEKEWVHIAEEDYYPALKWAAEGDMLYYLSRRDDFRCLYGQRLRASDKRPIGLPIPIRHFHSYRNYPNSGTPIAAALDKVVVRLTTRKSNIWALDLANIGH